MAQGRLGLPAELSADGNCWSAGAVVGAAAPIGRGRLMLQKALLGWERSREGSGTLETRGTQAQVRRFRK